MLYNERPGRVWIKRPGAAPQRVNLALPRIWARSEGGLLSLVADPGAASNGYFYSCMSVAASAARPKDVEVWKWKLTSPTTATRVRTMVSGLPIGSGRHNGCRMVIHGNDLFIGTGDAAQGANPQSLGSLGGEDPAGAARRVDPDGQPLLPARRQRPLRVDVRAPQRPGSAGKGRAAPNR